MNVIIAPSELAALADVGQENVREVRGDGGCAHAGEHHMRSDPIIRPVSANHNAPREKRHFGAAIDATGVDGAG